MVVLIAIAAAVLVAVPALVARRVRGAAPRRIWVALGVYAVALACTGYALLAVGMCAASGAEASCSAQRPLDIALPAGIVAAVALVALVALAARERRG